MAGWLGRLFGGAGKAAADPGLNEAKGVDHKGFRIVPAPRRQDAGWQIAGVISKDVGGEVKRSAFVRADVLPSREEAEDHALRKGLRIVDEQGERLFEAPGPQT